MPRLSSQPIDLVKESAEWVAEGIISESQAEAIVNRYQAKPEATTKPRVGYWVLMGFAALFVCLAIVLVLTNQWEDWPKALKTGAFWAFTVIPLGLGLRFQHRGQIPQAHLCFGAALFFQGGAFITLLELYALRPLLPSGFFLMTLLPLALALWTQSRWLMAMALIFATLGTLDATQLGRFPWFYPLWPALALRLAYWRRPSTILFGTSLVGLVLWVNLAVGWFLHPPEFQWGPEHIILSAGLLLTLFAGSSRLRSHKTALHKFLAPPGVFLLLIFSSLGPWTTVVNLSWTHPTTSLCGAWGLTFLAGTALWHQLKRPSPPPFPWELGTLLIAYPLMASLLIMTPFPASTRAIIFQIASNLAAIAVGLRLIYRGVEEIVAWRFYGGIGVLMTVTVLRFIHHVGSPLGAAVLFLVFAGVLYFSGRSWKRIVLTRPPSP